MVMVYSTFIDDDYIFEDAVPVESSCVSSRPSGARATLETLLPSDAEQLLRVRKSMAQKT